MAVDMNDLGIDTVVNIMAQIDDLETLHSFVTTCRGFLNVFQHVYCNKFFDRFFPEPIIPYARWIAALASLTSPDGSPYHTAGI